MKRLLLLLSMCLTATATFATPLELSVIATSIDGCFVALPDRDQNGQWVATEDPRIRCSSRSCLIPDCSARPGTEIPVSLQWKATAPEAGSAPTAISVPASFWKMAQPMRERLHPATRPTPPARRITASRPDSYLTLGVYTAAALAGTPIGHIASGIRLSAQQQVTETGLSFSERGEARRARGVDDPVSLVVDELLARWMQGEYAVLEAGRGTSCDGSLLDGATLHVAWHQLTSCVGGGWLPNSRRLKPSLKWPTVSYSIGLRNSALNTALVGRQIWDRTYGADPHWDRLTGTWTSARHWLVLSGGGYWLGNDPTNPFFQPVQGSLQFGWRILPELDLSWSSFWWHELLTPSEQQRTGFFPWPDTTTGSSFQGPQVIEHGLTARWRHGIHDLNARFWGSDVNQALSGGGRVAWRVHLRDAGALRSTLLTLRYRDGGRTRDWRATSGLQFDIGNGMLQLGAWAGQRAWGHDVWRPQGGAESSVQFPLADRAWLAMDATLDAARDESVAATTWLNLDWDVF
ncbi:MAG: hypothetical protein D6761_10820 [Candidatus Dadabacteria bacterium]|nr:MAG: hypothetical protein D6761_10820 [Candidatus Dadabacteria bacterium]